MASALGCHSDNGLAEIMGIQDSDECFRRVLQTVCDFLPIRDGTVRDIPLQMVPRLACLNVNRFGP